MVFGPAAALCSLATGSVQPDGTADEIRARRSGVCRSGLCLGQAPRFMMQSLRPCESVASCSYFVRRSLFRQRIHLSRWYEPDRELPITRLMSSTPPVRSDGQRFARGAYPCLVRSTPLMIVPLLMFHCSGSHYLRRIFEARRTSSSLQRVMEGQFSFRGHHAGLCHF